MAEVVVSALLPVLFEKLNSAAFKSIARYKELDGEISKWHRSLTLIQDVLADAAQKEIASQSVKQWLNDLQHLAYDIDDVLDDLATDAMDREFTRDSEAFTITSKVRKLIPSCCTNFSRSTKMIDKLDNINYKLQELLKEKADLGLNVIEEPRSKNINRRMQTSMIHEPNIVGRQVEKEKLVKQLLEGESCDQNFSIVPLVGMGGVGKTTLARLLYNEQKVNDHFELKAWVCVSDEFDSFAISKVIFQSVTGENKDFADLNLLQVALRNQLREKRFLLVLDDIWSESCDDWETLAGPFYACARGSKIIMTTRKEKLLKKLGYNHLNHLRSLSHDHALSLFAQHALSVNNFNSHLSLKPHGEGIVKKCDGLPLALIALGRLLRTKRDEEEYWTKVLNSEIWRLQDGGEIIPALILSYHDLSARLKQLFAYCSLFPKDFRFDREELVLLWMGEGFLHESPSRDLTEEIMGHEYFDELLSRSFFQHAPNNESMFVMHDMMNDLATYVASEFFVRLDIEEKKDFGKLKLEKYRHMSFVREKFVTYKKFEAFKRAKSLRTFLPTSVERVKSYESFYLSSMVLDDLLRELPMLRVLCLSNFYISEIPESIGTLRHLRYLNLSRTQITHLPENVCNLYNLQTLIVVGCHLSKFPDKFFKLKNLKHLDIRDTRLLDRMPLGIGMLKKLQTLSKIIIEGESGFKITELKELKNLCGKISIVGLEKVQKATHAREANLSPKRLSKLEVEWSDAWEVSRNEMHEKDVLNELKPRNGSLKKLKIMSYGGLEFPIWVGDTSFIQLKHVSIHGCKKCTSLPPLGQLPSLNELFVEGLEEVKVVGMELLGNGLTCPSLEILSFRNMGGWEKWSTNSGVVSFPRLQKLYIRNCPNLVEVSLETLPSLNDLEIYDCRNLVEVSIEALPSLIVLKIDSCDRGVLRRLVEVAPIVTDLKISYISGLNDVVWRGVKEYLGTVEELSICRCNEIRYLWESEEVASKVLMNLKNLRVKHCDNLVSLGEKEYAEHNCMRNLLTSLRSLDVSSCKNMERCICPDSIETLRISWCSSITSISLSNGGQKLKSFQVKVCDKLLGREWGGKKMNNRSSMPMLEYVSIERWPNLKSIIKLNCLVHLTYLTIYDCEGLESLPDNELPNLTSLKRLHITNCQRMDACFPRGFWPPNLQSLEIGKLKKPISEWGSQNFPTSLIELRLYGGSEDGVSSCSQFSNLLPSSLTSLVLEDFKKLESFSMGLQHLQRLSFYSCPNLHKLSHPHPQHLTSLQHLFFDCCPNMMDLSEELLPSLLSLRIWLDCPKLKERCSKGGSYWPLISHIPCIDTDFY